MCEQACSAPEVCHEFLPLTFAAISAFRYGAWKLARHTSFLLSGRLSASLKLAQRRFAECPQYD